MKGTNKSNASVTTTTLKRAPSGNKENNTRAEGAVKPNGAVKARGLAIRDPTTITKESCQPDSREDDDPQSSQKTVPRPKGHERENEETLATEESQQGFPCQQPSDTAAMMQKFLDQMAYMSGQINTLSTANGSMSRQINTLSTANGSMSAEMASMSRQINTLLATNASKSAEASHSRRVAAEMQSQMQAQAFQLEAQAFQLEAQATKIDTQAFQLEARAFQLEAQASEIADLKPKVQNLMEFQSLITKREIALKVAEVIVRSLKSKYPALRGYLLRNCVDFLNEEGNWDQVKLSDNGQKSGFSLENISNYHHVISGIQQDRNEIAHQQMR
ncbi:unnamed protein product [Cylindrotheca closterium]|uniref:Uncharacterized protein n=1 Tax=Cylindrotheca closterium TaxID=2856 RepID=A0AAD2FKP8_9STRA|nr:unnamed protein product [Cylindrotheca closterium]